MYSEEKKSPVGVENTTLLAGLILCFDPSALLFLLTDVFGMDIRHGVVFPNQTERIGKGRLSETGLGTGK